MNPTDLDLTLAVLRKHGAVSAEVPTTAGPLRVVFTPDTGPLPVGEELTSGGWKGPSHLDRDPMDDERGVP